MTLSETKAPSVHEDSVPLITATISHTTDIPAVVGNPAVNRTLSPDQVCDLSVLKWKIDKLPILYGVLFGLSLLLQVLAYTRQANVPSAMTFALIFLFAAVCTRIYRIQLVNEYNNIMSGRFTPVLVNL
jgi:hypothetical protein